MDNKTNPNKIREEFGKDCIGVVVRIISETKIIVSCPYQIPQIGELISVYDHGESIYDQYGNNLGTLDTIKDSLTVTQTGEHFIIAEKKRYDSPFEVAVTSPLLNHNPIPLNIEKSDIKPLKNVDMTIHIGDPVKIS